MVPLPLFKIAALFVRHVSKYGANRIKIQAHEHVRFRRFAARYGQMIHQLNMRLSVALMRNVEAELKAKEAKEKAEAPTVKTKEQTEKDVLREEALKAKQQSASPAKDTSETQEKPKGKTASIWQQSIWRRRFRPLPEAKAVDLFADVIGDAFILFIATALVIYEYHRSSQKPDANLERIKALNQELDELKQRESQREEEERRQESRIIAMEEALRSYKDPKTKKPLLSTPTPTPTPTSTPVAAAA